MHEHFMQLYAECNNSHITMKCNASFKCMLHLSRVAGQKGIQAPSYLQPTCNVTTGDCRRYKEPIRHYAVLEQQCERLSEICLTNLNASQN